MKKYVIILVAMMVSFFCLPGLVFADNKVIIEFYNYNSINEVPPTELIAFNAVWEMSDDLSSISEVSSGSAIQTTTVYGKPFAKVARNLSTNETTYELLLDDFTTDNDYEYTFTEADKTAIASNAQYSPLSVYDGVILKFSNKPPLKEVLIKKVEFVEKTGNAETFGSTIIDGMDIKANIKFKNLNDSAVYRAIIKNNTDIDYYIDEKPIENTSEYINYEFEYEDGNDFIKAGTTKNILIKITYSKEAPEELLTSGVYETNNVVGVKLSTEREIDNPNTNDNVMKTTILLIESIILLMLALKLKTAKAII